MRRGLPFWMDRKDNGFFPCCRWEEELRKEIDTCGEEDDSHTQSVSSPFRANVRERTQQVVMPETFSAEIVLTEVGEVYLLAQPCRIHSWYVIH